MKLRYLNFDLRLSVATPHPEGGLRFLVQVQASPVGEATSSETVVLTQIQGQLLQSLDRRQLDGDAMLDLGWQLGELLLPPLAHDFFLNSLSRLKPDEGLRLRIACEDGALDAIPWEIACARQSLDNAREALGKRAYLALAPRLSLVRRVVGSSLLAIDGSPASRPRLLAMVCEPQDRRHAFGPLQLERELQQLRMALDDCPDVELVVCTPATRQALAELLAQGAEVFHFAGHGELDAAGRACLVLEDDCGISQRFPVDELAMHLTSKGIRLAVLGACQSARVGGHSNWSAIAPSLVRAGVAAAIGMQHSIYDQSALAFSRRFYQCRSKQMSLDEAVAEARRAVLDEVPDSGRDFTTPVLYLGGEQQDAPNPDPLLRLAPFLKLLSNVADYKEVHDVLHAVAMQEFPELESRRDSFPDDAQTRRTFSRHAAELRCKLLRLRAVDEHGCCEPTLIRNVVDEFSDALGRLDKALRERCTDELDAALFAFESLLASAPSKIDHRMCELALQRMSEFVVALPLPRAASEPALHELRHLSEELRRSAALHNQCQGLGRDLALFLKTRAARPFKSTRTLWQALLARLSLETAVWNASAAVANLRSTQAQFEAAVAGDQDELARSTFEDLCAHFNYGFFEIDTDFKRLCARLKQHAEASALALH